MSEMSSALLPSALPRHLKRRRMNGGCVRYSEQFDRPYMGRLIYLNHRISTAPDADKNILTKIHGCSSPVQGHAPNDWPILQRVPDAKACAPSKGLKLALLDCWRLSCSIETDNNKQSMYEAHNHQV